MKITLSFAMTCIFITFSTILFVSMMNFCMAIQRIDTYHYAVVNEIESSDFSPYAIQTILSKSPYHLQIEEKSIKEDLRIYQVTTSSKLSIPILGYTTNYRKQSIAR